MLHPPPSCQLIWAEPLPGTQREREGGDQSLCIIALVAEKGEVRRLQKAKNVWSSHRIFVPFHAIHGKNAEKHS
jgi:hypothetical protein